MQAVHAETLLAAINKYLTGQWRCFFTPVKDYLQANYKLKQALPHPSELKYKLELLVYQPDSLLELQLL